MATDRTNNRTMISQDMMIIYVRLDKPSYPKKEAARILGVDVPTMMAMKPRLETFTGYRQERISLAELKRMLDQLDITFEQEKEVDLPARTRRRLNQIRGGAEI